MAINYEKIDTDARGKALVAATGHGDTDSLTEANARAAEQAVCVLKLREAFFNEHATSVNPNGADPSASTFASQRDALATSIAEAEAARDRIVAATGADVSGVMAPILAANRTKAEQDHFDADWKAVNVPGLSQAELDECQLICDRAEREVAVIEGWT